MAINSLSSYPASSEVKGVLRSILLYNLNSTCSILILRAPISLGDMSAGSLAKAISKSGSSLPTRYSRPSISSSSIRAPSSHSKILSLFLL
jgi:hypothetical protein